MGALERRDLLGNICCGEERERSCYAFVPTFVRSGVRATFVTHQYTLLQVHDGVGRILAWIFTLGYYCAL